MKINKEYINKLRDHKFYLENFCKIKTKEKGLQLFKLKEAQKHYFNCLRKYTKIIILKARQLGFSSGTTGFFYVDTITRPGITSALVGYNSDMVTELLDKVKTLYHTTPKAMRPTIQYDSKFQMSFPEMQSKIIVLPNTRDVGRGYTINNCLAGNTKILMPGGFYKEIKDLKIGDLVLNGSGGPTKVTNILERKNEKRTLRIKMYGHYDDLVLTEDHKVLCREKVCKGKTSNNEVWVESKNINPKDYIAFPYFQCRNRFKKIKINDFIEPGRKKFSNYCPEEIDINYEFGLFIGWYLAEGHIPEKCNNIIFCINHNKIDEVLKVIEPFKKYFGKMRVRTKKDTLSTTISLEGANFARFINSIFGRTTDKNINDCVWYWGWDFCKGLLFGLFSSDGYFKNKYCVILTNTNEQIINQTKKLLVSLRIGLATIRRNESFRYGVKGKDRFDLYLGGKGNYKFRRLFGLKLPVYNNARAKWRTKNLPSINQGFGYWLRGRFHYWAKVYEVMEEKEVEKVYDISVDDKNHCFTTVNGVVHNCLITELSSPEWGADAEEKFTGLKEAITPNGRLVIESCVTGDTIVLTEDGPKHMIDIHDWDNNPLGFSTGKNIKLDGHYGLQPTNTYYNSGIKSGFRIRTRRGYEIGMSSIHKLFVLRDGKLEFVKAKDLKTGDLLAIKYGQELWGSDDKVDWTPSKYPGFNKQNIKLFNPEVITEDLAYLIGVILGDGYVSKKSGQTVITNIDKDLTDFLLNKPLGLKFYQGKRTNHYHYYCSNQSFIEFLQGYIGFKEGVKAPKKEIPNIVLGWSRKNVVAFLQGLFDADGSCRKDRGNVSFTSTSKQIIDIMRFLLLNFGIISRTYSYNAKPSKKVKVWSSGYRLELTVGQSKKFIKEIGFRIRRKQQNVFPRKDSYDCFSEFIPGIGKTIKSGMKELGLKYSDISRGLNKGLFSKSGNITYRVLKKILDKCRNKDSSLYKNINELYEYKYLYDDIVKIDDIEENVYDFTVDNGHTVVGSGFVGHNTPRGVGNLYHRLWMTDNEFVKLKYGWWWEYTREQMMAKRKALGEMMWAQEYGLRFLSSGRNVFDMDAIEKARKFVLNVGEVNEPVVEGQKICFVKKDGDLVVYREPEPEGIYCVGADVSEGVGGDYSVAIIWDRKTGEEVAMYRGQIHPDRFGSELNKWGRKYNNAMMVVEVNNHGLTTLTTLRNLIYPSLYMRPVKMEAISSGFSDRLGWRTTKLTRPLLLDDLGQHLREGSIIIHSKKLLDEMSVFIYDKDGNMMPSGGFTDDCIFAGGIGLQAFKQLCGQIPTQLDHTKYLPKTFAY